MVPVLVFLVAAASSWFVVWVLLPLLRGRVMDVPNERSLHDTPTPRGGGVAIVFPVSLVLVWALMTRQLAEGEGVVLFGALAMALVGVADDFLNGLRIGVRLLMQIAVAVGVVFFVGPLSALPFPAPANVAMPSSVAWLVTLGWILGVTNIFNFLDGIDGFSSLQGVIAGLALGWVLAPGGVASMAALAAAGGSLGFLFHNWQPASIFLGDVGSLFLGFLFAALPLAESRDAVGPAVFVTGMALWFFLSDGVFTLVRRMVQRERFWDAHRTHLYQMLVQSGCSHAKVSSVVMTCGAVVTLVAVWSIQTGTVTGQWAVLAGAVVVFVGYAVVVGVLVARR